MGDIVAARTMSVNFFSHMIRVSHEPRARTLRMFKPNVAHACFVITTTPFFVVVSHCVQERIYVCSVYRFQFDRKMQICCVHLWPGDHDTCVGIRY